MDLSWSAGDLAFGDEARGWAAPARPVEYGGCDWSVAIMAKAVLGL
jgi:hypothetical protein